MRRTYTRTRRLAAVLAVISLLIACKKSSVNQDSEVAFQEEFRPQFHFTPPAQWMNDPNGLVHHKGVYHLFYQHYPDSTVWGPMHWGHAISKDLVRWEHKPIALYPDQLGYIFSGSAVVDKDNRSGFGTSENPPLVAIYTYHLMAGEKAGRKDFQTQGIAYSLDNGDSWTKYDGNPVIGNKDIKDFRDPKVFWHEATHQWVLVLVAGDHVKLYRSDNLKQWNLMSEFGRDIGAHGGVWECPDLFEIGVEGSDQKKWVLLVSVNPGAPNGGSGTQYFVGDFDGTSFSTDQDAAQWIDQGRDNYAGVTYNNTPDQDRIFIGWMSNWDYAQTTPTDHWRSAMTLPRSLSLHQDSQGQFYLKNYPLEQLSVISKRIVEKKSIDISQTFTLSREHFNQTELIFDMPMSEPMRLNLGNEWGEQITLTMDPDENIMTFDRRQSGSVDFDQKFAVAIQNQTYKVADRLAEVRMIIDASSVEVFIDRGRYVFTNQIFPTEPYTELDIIGAPGASIENFKINNINSIWQNE